jgi:hypothetical protein
MPIFRYFAVVGASLLALLFLTGAYLPAPTYGPSKFQIDKSTIRITSRVHPQSPIIIEGAENVGF